MTSELVLEQFTKIEDLEAVFMLCFTDVKFITHQILECTD